MEIKYCIFDDDPALIVRPGDGRLYTHLYIKGAWKPGNGETWEIVQKAKITDEATFKKIFPTIGMPEKLDA
jgi:hypothetical protein